MAKRRRQTDSDGTTPTAATYNTIFIDTSLDTHLAMIVSDSDTVSIVKEKIVSEHTRCFPETGEIRIDALKVKRKGYFYHLPDYMHVKSAFEGAKKSWFLYVDASSLKAHNDMQQLVKLDVSNVKALVCIENCPQGLDQQDLPDDRSKTPSAIHESANGKAPNGSDSRPSGFTGEVSKDIAMEVGCNADTHCNDLSSATSKSSALRVQKFKDLFEKDRVLETLPGFKDDKSKGVNRNIQSCTSIGQLLETANPAKKHKSRRNAVVACSVFRDNNASMRVSNENASQFETVTIVKDTGNKEDQKLVGSNVVSEPLKDDHQTKSSIAKKTKKKRIKDLVHHHDEAAASVLSSTPVVEVKRSFQQDPAASEPSELSQNQMRHGDYQDEGKGCSLPGSSKDLHEPYDVNLEGKIDVSEQAAESQKGRVSSEKLDETKNEYSPPPVIAVLHDVSTIDQANKSTEERELSPNRDPGLMLASLKHVPGQGKADTSVEDPNVSAKFLNVHEATGDGNPGGSKQKKKKAKKSSAKVLDTVNMNPDNNEMNGISSPALNTAANGNLSNEIKSNERFIPCTQTDQTKRNKEERDSSDRDEADVTATESGFKTRLSDANVAKVRKVPGIRKKKSARKSATAVCQDASDMEHADHCVSHSTTAHDWRTSEKIEEDRNLFSSAESNKTSKIKSSEASARSGRRKVDKLSGDEELLCPITQTAETEEKGENMDGRMRRNIKKGRDMGKKNIQNVPSKEQGNEIERGYLDEAVRGIVDAGNSNKIVKKKTKIIQSSAENNRESLPINAQRVNEEIIASDDKFKEVEAPPKEQGNEKARMQLNQKNESCENTENVERKSGKKTKKNRSPAATSHSSLPIKDQVAVGYVGDTAASNGRLAEVDTSSKAPESLVYMPLVLDPSNKTQEHAGSTTKKAKKATGNRSSAAESHSNLPIKDKGDVENIATSIHRLRELDSPSKTTRKHHLNQLAVSESEYQKNAVENNFEGTETEDNTCNLAEVARCEGEEINFKQYFVPGQPQQEVFMKPSAEKIAEKKAEENGVSSISPELQQDLPKLYKNKGSIVTSAGKAKNTTKSSKVMKTKEMEKHGVPQAPASWNLDEIKTLQKPIAAAILNGCDTNKSLAADVKENGKSLGKSSSSSSSSSRSSSESSERITLKKRDEKESGLGRHVVTSKRTSTKLSGKVANSLKREKSLLSTPKSIFNDVSDESSGDENGPVDSDASTRTPSDNSSSSGYSPDASDHSDNSMKNGANGVKRKGGSRQSILKPELPGLKQIPMDTIFRSSSRFKKAKLTATQQLNDTESQPVEVVPDSQTHQ